MKNMYMEIINIMNCSDILTSKTNTLKNLKSVLPNKLCRSVLKFGPDGSRTTTIKSKFK